MFFLFGYFFLDILCLPLIFKLIENILKMMYTIFGLFFLNVITGNSLLRCVQLNDNLGNKIRYF